MALKIHHIQNKHIKKDAIAKYTMHGVETGPDEKTLVLTVKPATADNRLYICDAVNNSPNKTQKKNRKIQEEDLIKIEKDENELFVKHIIQDWENLWDDDGKEIPYSKENCRELLNVTLPRDFVEDLKDFCSEIENFRSDSDDKNAKDSGKPSKLDKDETQEELAGNSD